MCETKDGLDKGKLEGGEKNVGKGGGGGGVNTGKREYTM